MLGQTFDGFFTNFDISCAFPLKINPNNIQNSNIQKSIKKNCVNFANKNLYIENLNQIGIKSMSMSIFMA